jgi:hypothetical protein
VYRELGWGEILPTSRLEVKSGNWLVKVGCGEGAEKHTQEKEGKGIYMGNQPHGALSTFTMTTKKCTV